MAYEIFSRKISRVGVPMLSVTKLGRISLNMSATKRLSKDAVEFVILLWDKDSRKIGIRPITKKDSRAYRVGYGLKGNGAGFSAKTFLDFIDFDYSESHSFPVEWNDSENMYEAEIPIEHSKDSRQRRLLPLDSSSKLHARGPAVAKS